MLLKQIISLLQLVALADLVAGLSVQRPRHHRQKRHLLQMCELIAQHTDRGCLEYNNYGCFCGLGNANSRPLDEVDECCRLHDRCYGDAACYWIYPQMAGYSTNCSNGSCSCTDSPLFASCAYTTCRCDLEFAECLGRAEYNDQHYDFDRSQCTRRRRRGRYFRRRAKREATPKKSWLRQIGRL